MLMTNLTAPHFQNETNAREHLEAIRWPLGPVCPHCESMNATRLQGSKHRAGAIQCNDCRQQYTVTVGTLFERSKVPLHKWLLCNHLLCSSKKGMSAKQIERLLGVTYKTAWFMCHRIREAMKGCQPTGPLGGGSGVVEADETYVGGKARNRAHSRPADKKAVVALVEREGHVRSFHVANVNAKTVRALIVTNVDRSAHLITDESPVYTRVGREFGAHYSVNHSAKQFVTHGGYKHSNTAENFFSIFKRGVIGTYHHMSEAHLGRYTGEFDFRYNTRKLTDGERAVISLQAIEGKRLTYRRTNKLAA